MKIGIDLGGSHVGVGLIEGENILSSRDRNFKDEDRKDIKQSIFSSIDTLISEIFEEKNIGISDIELIGVASPGTISNGVVLKAENLGIENLDIASELKNKYNVPVIVRNDAKAAALAEKKYGAMKDYDDCVFLTLGTGIGGAAFLGGKLLTPKKSSGLEFGHIIIQKDGRQCTCGKKGCFETYASIRALKLQVTKDLNMSSDISGQYLRENLLILDNEKVQADLEEYLEYLRMGIGGLIDIFEPEVICIGGSFSHYEGNPIFDRLVNKINQPDTTFNHRTDYKVVLAHFKNDAGIIGATIEE